MADALDDACLGAKPGDGSPPRRRKEPGERETLTVPRICGDYPFHFWAGQRLSVSGEPAVVLRWDRKTEQLEVVYGDA